MKFKCLCSSFVVMFLFLVGGYCLANDAAIYANGDGTYTYFGQTYSLEEFPMDKVVVLENKVQIFPVDNIDVNLALSSIRPLARKFIKAGHEVETQLFGKVIPYLVKKKGQ